MGHKHWADQAADEIIRIKGDKEEYTVASGITPSGTVHIGNFREIISTEMVARALKEKGKKVRFIYSWDDYDVFRKVPKNMPNQEALQKCLRMSITSVPDTTGVATSYARKNEIDVEKDLPRVGIHPAYIYQANEYQSGRYAQDMKRALEVKPQIIKILNEFRSEPLDDSWWPISVFSGFTGKDTTRIDSWDGDWGITYTDTELGKSETIDLRNTKLAKLHWRVDWPMRWAKEGVDFEPAGKDHHSKGGSFDTSKSIVKLFGSSAPVSFQYDFLRLKEGTSGKMSSSSGEVVTLSDLLNVYTPEVVRYLFSSTRVNSEFQISFDADVLKIYEDYEKCERIAFGIEDAPSDKVEVQKRIWELSQPFDRPTIQGYQVTFRHLCTLLQIHSFDTQKVISILPNVLPEQMGRLSEKVKCASYWIQNFAPSEFQWRLKTPSDPMPELTEGQKKALAYLSNHSDEIDTLDLPELSKLVYSAAEEAQIENSELFDAAYRTLIGSPKGPRLAQFLKTLGGQTVKSLLSRK